MSAWRPGEAGNPVPSPSYPIPIPILDFVAPTLGVRRKRRWRKAVRYAIGQWSQSSVAFTLEERTLALNRYGDYAPWATEPHAINLGRWPYVWPWALDYLEKEVRALGGFDGPMTSMECGYALYDVDWMVRVHREYPEESTYDWRHTVTHEIGHALGFGHGDKRDGAWMMGSGSLVCSEVEIAATKEYYL